MARQRVARGDAQLPGDPGGGRRGSSARPPRPTRPRTPSTAALAATSCRAELADRRSRLARLRRCREELEAEQAAGRGRLCGESRRRAEWEAEHGRKLGGRKPFAPDPDGLAKRKINTTDPDTRMIVRAGKAAGAGLQRPGRRDRRADHPRRRRHPAVNDAGQLEPMVSAALGRARSVPASTSRSSASSPTAATGTRRRSPRSASTACRCSSRPRAPRRTKPRTFSPRQGPEADRIDALLDTPEARRATAAASRSSNRSSRTPSSCAASTASSAAASPPATPNGSSSPPATTSSSSTPPWPADGPRPSPPPSRPRHHRPARSCGTQQRNKARLSGLCAAAPSAGLNVPGAGPSRTPRGADGVQTVRTLSRQGANRQLAVRFADDEASARYRSALREVRLLLRPLATADGRYVNRRIGRLRQRGQADGAHTARGRAHAASVLLISRVEADLLCALRSGAGLLDPRADAAVRRRLERWSSALRRARLAVSRRSPDPQATAWSEAPRCSAKGLAAARRGAAATSCRGEPVGADAAACRRRRGAATGRRQFASGGDGDRGPDTCHWSVSLAGGLRSGRGPGCRDGLDQGEGRFEHSVPCGAGCSGAGARGQECGGR